MSPEISIIVPALNEAENLPELAQRIDAALGGTSHEIIIVDDNSRDGTPRVCEELSAKHPLKLLLREKPMGGLSGAVLHGINNSTGRIIVVMDADLQHPPEKLPELVAAIEGGSLFALGSRYVQGGGTFDRWTLYRRLNSGLATLLAMPLCGSVRDPMSGFFALSRQTYSQSAKLSPLGYKIALELICKCRVKSVIEIPIHFDERKRGMSKLSLKQQLMYITHIDRLYSFAFPIRYRLVKLLLFLGVILVLWAVGLKIASIVCHS